MKLEETILKKVFSNKTISTKSCIALKHHDCIFFPYGNYRSRLDETLKKQMEQFY